MQNAITKIEEGFPSSILKSIAEELKTIVAE